MRVTNISIIMMELLCLNVLYSCGIRVHEDELDDSTIRRPLLVKSIVSTSNESVNSSTSTRIENRTITESKNTSVIDTTASNLNTTTNVASKEFIPSPELVVDASQSSESNEKFIIRNDHHFIPHFNYFHDNSRSITATNHSHEQPQQQQQYDYAKYGPSTTTAESYAAVHYYETAINKNERLPWPYEYENAEKEFKWKTVKPMLPYDIYHVRTKEPYHTIKLNPTIPFSPTISYSADSTLTSPTSIYHPYVFENVASDLNVNQPNFTATYGSDILPSNQPNSFNLYAQPIDDHISYGLREQTNPVDFIDKRIFWHTALKWLATAIPIGLAISAFAPNVVIVNANSTGPHPSVRFPIPYTTVKPSPIQFPSRKINSNNNYAAFLKRSEEFRLEGDNYAANVCSNRYLCELGSAAVDEKNATRSAHTLFKSLWRLPNERSQQMSLDDMNNIFKSIQDGTCDRFDCFIG